MPLNWSLAYRRHKKPNRIPTLAAIPSVTSGRSETMLFILSATLVQGPIGALAASLAVLFLAVAMAKSLRITGAFSGKACPVVANCGSQDKKPRPARVEGLGLHLRDGAAIAKLILVIVITTSRRRQSCIARMKVRFDDRPHPRRRNKKRPRRATGGRGREEPPPRL
jgi:hypothetical protein